MTARIRIVFLIILSVIIQAALIPAHFPDPFKPNLMIIFVVYMGFMENARWGGTASFLLGLVQDSLSGIYFGLNGFSYLLVFIILKAVAHRLYTDSRSVVALAVFLATVVSGLASMLLLAVYLVAPGLYSDILSDVLPQGLTNALIAYFSFTLLRFRRRDEMP